MRAARTSPSVRCLRPDPLTRRGTRKLEDELRLAVPVQPGIELLGVKAHEIDLPARGRSLGLGTLRLRHAGFIGNHGDCLKGNPIHRVRNIMRSPLSLALALLVGIAGFFLGWGVGRSARAEPARAAASRNDTVPRAHVEQLRKELGREKEKLGKLQTKLDAALAAIEKHNEEPPQEKPTDGDVPEAPAVDPRKPTFVYEGMEEALAAIDWNSVGQSVDHLPPLLVKLAEALLAGKPYPPEAGEIQRWNGPLVTQALTAMQAGVKGTGVNGSFSHPAMTVNLVASALRQSDVPLSENQDAALEELGRRFTVEEKARQEGYADDVPALERVMEEAALKARLVDDLEKVLGTGQVNKLRPKELRGYAMIDIVSDGVMLGPLARPVPFKTRADLQKNTTARFAKALGLGDDARPALENAVRVWAQRFDDEFLAVKQKAFHRTDRIRQAGANQIELQRAILATVPLTDAQKKTLRASSGILVPYRR